MMVKLDSTLLRMIVSVLVMKCMNTLTPLAAHAQNPALVCPHWTQESQPISTHMNLRGLSDLPQGLPLETLVYRHAHGTWLQMELGYYNDFLFETLNGPTRSRRSPAPFFEEAEASQTKADLTAYLDDALRARAAGETRELPFQAFLIPGTVSSEVEASDMTRNLSRTRISPGDSYAFWYPSGRYIERDLSNFYSPFPCESGRPNPILGTSEEFAVVFQIKQGFVPFHSDSNYQAIVANTREWISGSEPDHRLGNTYPYSTDLDTSVRYQIHHADGFVAQFTCRPMSNASNALPPSCEGIAFWPEEGLAVSMRFPSQQGVAQGEALYVRPVQAVYEIIQKWKIAGENNG